MATKKSQSTKPIPAQARPESYTPRIVDSLVETYLQLFGGVEISGTKWCGKTWTALAHANSVTYVDRGANLALTQADPSYALIGETPHVIDEWQRVPAIWDTVRHAIDDAGRQKGLWILTGSSTPPAAEEKAHSGAGRIGRIRMHPMTLFEMGTSSGAVSLSALFEGKFSPCQRPANIQDVARLVCKGGWPEEVDTPSASVQIIIRKYLDLIFQESVPRLGGSENLARRVALSLARNLGQSPKLKTIASDVFAPEDGKPSEYQKREASATIELLGRLFLVDEIAGWVPPSRSPLRMRTKPRYYFADPSIPVALLGLGEEALLQDMQTLGLAFENLVMRDLAVYSSVLPNMGPGLRYYRDDSNLEADVIIERNDGSWAAIEIKLSQDKVEGAAVSLLRLKEKVLKNKKANVRPPEFMAVIVGVGEAAYQRPDGVYVIPIAALGV